VRCPPNRVKGGLLSAVGSFLARFAASLVAGS
jgi:hypothetical protein